jgi:hypothetical protein
VPFNLFRKREQPPPPEAATAGSAPFPGEMPFEAFTEDWRLIGRMQLSARLSDVLNRRESIPISEVRWAPLDGSEPMTDAPGLREVDPYDLIVVFTSALSLPADDEHRVAMRVRKTTYDVLLDLGILRVIGKIYLYPGADPSRLLDRQAELFIPVTHAAAYHGERRVGDEKADVLLVNRSYLRSVQQLEVEANPDDEEEAVPDRKT